MVFTIMQIKMKNGKKYILKNPLCRLAYKLTKFGAFLSKYNAKMFIMVLMFAIMCDGVG